MLVFHTYQYYSARVLTVLTSQEAWDSYIQNNALDPANEMWSSTIDIPMPNIDGQEQQEQQRQQQNNGYNNVTGVFMGVSTPPGNMAM